MKIAEALAERSDLQARLEVLRRRLETGARIQEGDTPETDPQLMLDEAEAILVRLAELIARINATNAITAFDETMTVTDAIAQRDIVAKRRKFYHEVAEAGSYRQDRYTRNEVKYVPVVDITEMRARADAAAKRYRELDTRLQQLNWTTELV